MKSHVGVSVPAGTACPGLVSPQGWGLSCCPPTPGPLRLPPPCAGPGEPGCQGASTTPSLRPRTTQLSAGSGLTPAGAGAQRPKQRQEEAPRTSGTGGGGASRALTAESRMSVAPASLGAPGDLAGPCSHPRKGCTPAPGSRSRAGSRG